MIGPEKISEVCFYAPSRWLNRLTGGSIDEYYCSRVYRENKVRHILVLNWIFFVVNTDDVNHCKRVNESGRKDGI